MTPFEHGNGSVVKTPVDPRPSVPAPTRSPARERAAARKRSGAIAAGAVVIALAVVLPFLIGNNGGKTSTTNLAGVRPRIAVLPFEDNTPDKSLGYLTNGLTEGLIDALSNVRGLEVRSKGGVRHYYENQKIAQDSLGRVLNVDWLVEGSLTRSNNQLRANVRLVDAATMDVRAATDTVHVWSDFLELRDTIVADVAILLRRAMGREIEVRQLRAGANNEQAWANYLRAKQIHDDFVAYMLENGVDAAEKMLQLADSLALAASRDDPRWIAPVVLRGRLASQRVQVILNRSGFTNSAAIRRALVQAIDFADKAITFDRAAPEGYELRGLMRYRLRVTPRLVDDTVEMRKMETAIEADLLHAVTIDSARAESWSTLSELYMRQSRLAQAQRTALRAYESDSYYAGALETLYRLSVASFEIGNETAARKYCDEGRRRFPRYHHFVYCELMLMAWSDTIKPDIDSAWRLAQIRNLVASPTPQETDAMFKLMTASVIARADRPDSALHVIDALPGRVRAALPLMWIEAAARARVGDFDRADSLIAAFVARNGVRNSWVLNSRALKPVRDEHLKAASSPARR